MEIARTNIPDVLIVHPRKHSDHRGFFSEVFKSDELSRHGVDLNWVQDNHSYSVTRGVVRGLHFQLNPHAQAKLIRVVRGAIFDVVVDLRRQSPTFGRHVAVELSADNWAQVLVPEGFAHGFCTLTDHTEVLYKVTAPHAPAHEGGIAWNDPDLGIAWPVTQDQAILTERDKAWPALRDFNSPF